MKLTEEQRQALGEALTNTLAAMCPESDLSRGPVAPDWFDSRNVDEVLDVIEQTLAAGVTEAVGWLHEDGQRICTAEQKRTMEQHQGLPGKRTAEGYSIPLVRGVAVGVLASSNDQGENHGND